MLVHITLPVVPIYGPPGLLLHCILGRWHINGTSNGHSNHHRVLSLSYISFARFFDSLQHNSNNKDNRNIELGNMHNHIQYTIQGLLARKLFLIRENVEYENQITHKTTKKIEQHSFGEKKNRKGKKKKKKKKEKNHR